MRESKKLRLLCLAALFAGAIAVTTAYLLHIPIPTGGYIQSPSPPAATSTWETR